MTKSPACCTNGPGRRPPRCPRQRPLPRWPADGHEPHSRINEGEGRLPRGFVRELLRIPMFPRKDLLASAAAMSVVALATTLGGPAPAYGQCSGCGNASFGPAARAFPASSFGPTVTADFNGDGIPDVALVGSSGSVHKVVVLLGDGRGGFLAPVSFPTAPSDRETRSESCAASGMGPSCQRSR